MSGKRAFCAALTDSGGRITGDAAHHIPVFAADITAAYAFDNAPKRHFTGNAAHPVLFAAYRAVILALAHHNPLLITKIQSGIFQMEIIFGVKIVFP